MRDVLKKLNFLLTKRDRQFLVGLVFLSVFVAMVETIGVSAIMPFMAVASNFSLVESNTYYKKFYELIGFESQIDFVIFFGIILIIFYIFRGIINLGYFYLLAKFSQGRYHLVAFKLYEQYLGMPYKKFVHKNSSYLTKSIVTEANGAVGLIKSFLMILSEFFVIILIYLTLIFVNWKITFLLTVLLTIKAILLTKTVSIKIKREGVKRAEFHKSLFEVINSTLGNFKIIKLFGNEQNLEANFKKVSLGYANSQILYQTLISIPRLFLEVVGFSLIVGLVIYILVKYQKDITDVIPLLSMYVLALYRLMPSFNRIMTAYNQILYQKKSLEIIHEDLLYDFEELGNEKLEFKRNIILKNLEFRYDQTVIFQNVNLEIKKGDTLALIGESGSGKSTFIDTIIGLYKSCDGEIFIDDIKLDESNIKSWRNKIGYIPQQIYLFDGTVGENVSFSREYNKDKIIEVLKKAKIWGFLERKEGLDTKVGEGGIQLSGGQKQRIAIARALYSDPEVLILDEATSALDSDTEKEIMNEIYTLSEKLTLIMVAHRISTLERCERIFKIEKSKIIQV